MLKTAKAWGKTPNEFRRIPNKIKAEMIAFEKVSSIIEAWHYEQMNAKMKMKKQPKRGKKWAS